MATDELKSANTRAARRRKGEPQAIAVRQDRRRNHIIIELNTGLEISFPCAAVQGLENASARDLDEIEISPSGFGIHFPKLDADLYLPALLEGLTGSRRWMAEQLGRVGGHARSPAKAAASRANGARGGRPRKSA